MSSHPWWIRSLAHSLTPSLPHCPACLCSVWQFFLSEDEEDEDDDEDEEDLTDEEVDEVGGRELCFPLLGCVVVGGACP